MSTTLYLYRAPSGQWSGRILVDQVEVCAIAGCQDEEDVLFTAQEQYELDFVETV